MADHTAATAKSATLSGTTQDTVTFSGAGHNIQVFNRHAANGLWVKVGDTDPGALTAGADDTLFVPAAGSIVLRARQYITPVVRLLGDGAGSNPFTVQAVWPD